MVGVFLSLSVLLYKDMIPFHTKHNIENVQDVTEFTSLNTVRDPAMEASFLNKAGFQYRCNNCHQHFEKEKSNKPLIAEHEDIILQHGINKSCNNCHHPDDKESLIGFSSDSKINFNESQLLCQKCHGPKYRDWQIGVHGRPMGYWDINKGTSYKPSCVSCHDPHFPKFKPIKPAPAPQHAVNEKDNQHDAT